jgi:hypothetical protein
MASIIADTSLKGLASWGKQVAIRGQRKSGPEPAFPSSLG